MAHVRRPGNHSARIAVEPLEDRTTPAAGFLDPTFGTGGLAITGFPLQGTFLANAEAHAIAVQLDGKIVIAGSTPNLTVAPGTDDLDMFVARLNPDGSLDTTFGNGGKVQIPFQGGGNNMDEANAVAIQPDGRIVVGGYATQAVGGKNFALVRLLSNGALDPTFGAGGKVVTDFTTLVPAISADDLIDSLVLQPDGKIVAAGFSTFNGMAVARYNSNGTIDKSFNGTGGNAVFPSIFSQDGAAGVALEGNKIVIVGTIGLNQDLGAARFNANGTLDGSFAGGGKFQAGFAKGGTGGAVAVQPNGQIVLAGSGNDGTTNGLDFAAVRLNPDGSRDGSFGSNGQVLVGVNLANSGADDIASGVVIEPSGKIVLGGTANGSPMEFASARLLPNGAPDPTWAVGGVGHYYVGTQSYTFNPIQAFALARNLDGTVLISGTNSTEPITLRLTSDTSQTGGVPPTIGGGVITPLFAAATDGPRLAAFSNGSVGPYNPNAPFAPNLAAIFPEFTGVVRSAVGDVDGDGIPDFALITGPGTPTRFAVVSGADLTSFVIPPTFPFRGSESFTGGGFVSVGSVDGSGRANVIVTPDRSGGPRVVVFSAAGTDQPPIVRADFFGIADPNFRGGARTAVGDLNGDGVPDLAVAAGAGGGARVAVYNGTTVLTTRTKLLGDFFAFEPGLRDGVYLAIGDVNADGFGDLIVGAGSGGGPRIRVASGKTLTQSGPIVAFGLPIADFFVGNNGSTRGGVRVAVKNVDGDNNADIIVGSGEGQPGNVRVYSGVNVAGRAEPFVSQDIPLFGTDPLPNGIFVG